MTITTLDEHLNEGGNGHEVEDVRQDGEQEDAAERAPDAAASTAEGGAAEHHRDDGVELEAIAGERVAGADPPGQHETGNAGGKARQDEDNEADACHWNAGAPRAFPAFPPAASR